VDTFKFPVSFRAGGIQKLTDGTDDYYAQLLALSIQIIPGELPLNPQYGVQDPTFSESLTRDLAFTAGAFIPEIIVETALISTDDSGVSKVGLRFRQRT